MKHFSRVSIFNYLTGSTFVIWSLHVHWLLTHQWSTSRRQGGGCNFIGSERILWHIQNWRETPGWEDTALLRKGRRQNDRWLLCSWSLKLLLTCTLGRERPWWARIYTGSFRFGDQSVSIHTRVCPTTCRFRDLQVPPRHPFPSSRLCRFDRQRNPGTKVLHGSSDSATSEKHEKISNGKVWLLG